MLPFSLANSCLRADLMFALSPLPLTPLAAQTTAATFSSSSGGEPYDFKVDGAGFHWVDGRYSRQGRELVDGAPYYTQHRRMRGGEPNGVGVMVSACASSGAF